MPFATLRDIPFYYEKTPQNTGSGKRLLYIGGTGGDLRVHPTIFDTPLARKFELLAFDQRGLGQSGKPDLPYRMADYAADAAALMDHLGWQSCAVLGESFGGMVAQHLALDFPGRVEKLVIVASSSGGAGGDSYPIHEIGKLPAGQLASTMVSLMDSRCDEEWRSRHPDEFRALAELLQRSLAPGTPEQQIGSRRQLEARMGHDTYDRLPRITCPTLACAGRYDQIAPTKNLQAISDQIPDAELAVFDGGHRFLQQDQRACEVISRFLT